MNRFYRYAQGFKEKHKHNEERIGRYEKEPSEILQTENTASEIVNSHYYYKRLLSDNKPLKSEFCYFFQKKHYLLLPHQICLLKIPGIHLCPQSKSL